MIKSQNSSLINNHTNISPWQIPSPKLDQDSNIQIPTYRKQLINNFLNSSMISKKNKTCYLNNQSWNIKTIQRKFSHNNKGNISTQKKSYQLKKSKTQISSQDQIYDKRIWEQWSISRNLCRKIPVHYVNLNKQINFQQKIKKSKKTQTSLPKNFGYSFSLSSPYRRKIHQKRFSPIKISNRQAYSEKVFANQKVKAFKNNFILNTSMHHNSKKIKVSHKYSHLEKNSIPLS